MKKKKSIGKIIFAIFAVLAILACLTLILYPMISNINAERNASKVEIEYKKEIEKTDTSELDEQRRLAIEYNTLLAGIITDSDAFGEDYLSILKDDYNKLLNVSDNGLMAYLEVPSIKVKLPIYHGNTDDEAEDVGHLEVGSVHLFGTSLPVGGNNTHTAISAHTGLSSNRLFTDLEKVKIGDVFYIDVLGERLAYQTVEINVVEPWDTSLLRVYKGHDYATLITCTPYGVNSHRLLVRGERIPYEEAKEIEKTQDTISVIESPWYQNWIKGMLIGLIPLALFLLLLVGRKLGKGQAKKHEKSGEATEKEKADKP